MIVPKDKNKDPEIVVPDFDITITDGVYKTEEEVIAGNPLEDLYNAVAKVIKGLRVDPKNPESPVLFPTVKWNMGQLNRVRNSKHNEEYALAFPACFIHFINVYWNLGMNRIGQAYAQLRICYVLNRLNMLDDEYQAEGSRVFKRIIEALNDDITIPTLTTRFQLSYWDQVESFDHGVQQFWITYEVRMNDYSSYRYKKYKPAYLVAPPFTNFTDMDADKNIDGKENVNRPMEEAGEIVDSVDTNTPTLNT